MTKNEMYKILVTRKDIRSFFEEYFRSSVETQEEVQRMILESDPKDNIK